MVFDENKLISKVEKEIVINRPVENGSYSILLDPCYTIPEGTKKVNAILSYQDNSISEYLLNYGSEDIQVSRNNGRLYFSEDHEQDYAFIDDVVPDLLEQFFVFIMIKGNENVSLQLKVEFYSE